MKIIAQGEEEGKIALSRVPDGALTIAVILLASGASFGLGILAGKGMEEAPEPVRIEGVVEAAQLPAAAAAAFAPKAKPVPAKATEPPAPVPGEGQYVASKTGSKYYLPWCGTVKRIKEENKVWFATKAEAEAAGYQPAANCKGL